MLKKLRNKVEAGMVKRTIEKAVNAGKLTKANAKQIQRGAGSAMRIAKRRKQLEKELKYAMPGTPRYEELDLKVHILTKHKKAMLARRLEEMTELALAYDNLFPGDF